MTTMARRTRRPKHSARRLDLSAVKEALKDDRVFPCMGLVTAEDVDSHFELDGTDLLIEVELIPGEERVSARLGFGAGPSAGLWFIPPVGAEVALIICDGDLEAGVFIVGVLSTGAVPAGVAEGVTVLAAQSKVLVHDGIAALGTDRVVKATPYSVHVHPSGTGPTGPADNAAPATTYSKTLEVD